MWRSCIENEGKLFVAENDESAVVGFVCVGSPRDDDLKEATELQAIYLDPHFYGSGIGTTLWKEVEKDLSTESVYLWVLSANSIGRVFYEKNGFRADGKMKALKVDGQAFEELRYRKILYNEADASMPT